MKLVICDLGGVVCKSSNVIPAIAHRLHLLPEEFSQLMAKEIEFLHRGKIAAAEFWRVFSQKTGYPVHGDLWEEEFHPVIDHEVLKALAAIRGKVRVVAGTNTIASHYHVLANTGVFSWFDAIYASHELGWAKPEPAFYRAILRQEGVRPKEALFIDDTQANVDGAKRLGLHAVIFKGVEDLMQVFEDLNLIKPEAERPG